MKRTVIYWKTKHVERNREVKEALGITSVSVNGESEYKGDMARLEPYIQEGLISIRMKDEEVRRKKVRVNTDQGQSEYCRTVEKKGRRRKVR